jgi:hypothetical protein
MAACPTRPARHKVQVSFTDDQWKLLKMLKGSMGNTDADIIRNIVVAWLSEKSIISESVKKAVKEESE